MVNKNKVFLMAQLISKSKKMILNEEMEVCLGVGLGGMFLFSNSFLAQVFFFIL